MSKAYYGNWLMLPKTRFNIPSLMNALTFPLRSRDRITGYVHAYKEDDTYFYVPREFYTESFLKRLNIELEYQVPEKYQKVVFKDSILLDYINPQKDIQRRAFAAMKTAGHGVLSLSCGLGKTVIALKYAAALQRPVLVIVETTGLLSQWAEEAQKWLGLKDSQIGSMRGSPDTWTPDKPFVLATIQSLARYAEEVPDIVRDRFGLAIFDECVEGDALIQTDEGLLSLREVVSGRADKALSYNEHTNRWEYRKILRRWRKGIKPTLSIKTSAGSIRVTNDHLIRTERGWIEARNLGKKDRILSPAPVGAENDSTKITDTDIKEGIPQDIRILGAQKLTGCKEQKRSTTQHPIVLVAARKSFESQKKSSGVIESRITNGANTYQGIIGVKACFLLLFSSLAVYTGLCWETHASITPILSLMILGLVLIMASSRSPGLSTRLLSCTRSGLGSLFALMVGMVKRTVGECLSAIQSYGKSIVLYGLVAQNTLPENGSKKSPLRVWLGGIWMTALSRIGGLHSTLRALLLRKWIRLLDGYGTWGIDATTSTLMENTGSSRWMSPHLSYSSTPFQALKLQEWSTNSLEILEVSPSEDIDVYDIEVEGSHNFVANGLLVHNCHHVSAPFFNRTAALFSGLRLGLSATPERSDGLEGLYLAHMGKIFFLDHSQDLVPTVDFHQVDLGVDWGSPRVLDEILDRTGELSWTRLWGYLGNNKQYLDEAVDLILAAARQGRKILVLSGRLHTVKKVNDALNASQGGLSDVITSKTKQDDRIKILRNSQVTVGITRIAREGLDEPALDTLVMMEPTSDPNILRQTVGRILRICSTKKQPEVHVMIARTDPCIRMMYAMRKNFKSWPRQPQMRMHK